MNQADVTEQASRERWDATAALWARITSSTDGEHDFYRTEFFGPAFDAFCGDVDGLRVLDVGCGAGYFSRTLAGRGAKVVGIDWSAQMIDHAKQAEQAEPLGIEYHHVDARKADQHFEPVSFDRVVGCMSFMDIPDPGAALAAAAKLVKPDGSIMMCNTHPIQSMQLREWERDSDGRKCALKLAGYFNDRTWLCEWGKERYGEMISVIQHHFTLTKWFEMIGRAGLVTTRLEEPCASDELVARCPALLDASMVPYILLMALGRAR